MGKASKSVRDSHFIGKSAKKLVDGTVTVACIYLAKEGCERGKKQ